jgi:hypothetical protein
MAEGCTFRTASFQITQTGEATLIHSGEHERAYRRLRSRPHRPVPIAARSTRWLQATRARMHSRLGDACSILMKAWSRGSSPRWFAVFLQPKIKQLGIGPTGDSA